MTVGKRKRRSVSYKDWITKEGLLKIEGWARDGLINEQIAHNIGIAEGTLYDWQNKYPEIAESLKRGKEVVDVQVENALLKRALGYEYEETKQIIEVDEKGGERKRQEKVKKRIRPDVTAQIFWLKNRNPDKWRDRKETNISGNITSNPMSELSVNELRAIIAKGEENDS